MCDEFSLTALELARYVTPRANCGTQKVVQHLGDYTCPVCGLPIYHQQLGDDERIVLRADLKEDRIEAIHLACVSPDDLLVAPYDEAAQELYRLTAARIDDERVRYWAPQAVQTFLGRFFRKQKKRFTRSRSGPSGIRRSGRKLPAPSLAH